MYILCIIGCMFSVIFKYICCIRVVYLCFLCCKLCIFYVYFIYICCIFLVYLWYILLIFYV